MHPKDKVWRVLVRKAMLVSYVSESGTQCEQMSIFAHSLFLLSSVFCLISTFRLFFFLPSPTINRSCWSFPSRIWKGYLRTSIYRSVSQGQEDGLVGTVRKLRKPWDGEGPVHPWSLRSRGVCPAHCAQAGVCHLRPCWLCRCRDSYYRSCCETLNRLHS